MHFFAVHLYTQSLYKSSAFSNRILKQLTISIQGWSPCHVLLTKLSRRSVHSLIVERQEGAGICASQSVQLPSSPTPQYECLFYITQKWLNHKNTFRYVYKYVPHKGVFFFNACIVTVCGLWRRASVYWTAHLFLSFSSPPTPACQCRGSVWLWETPRKKQGPLSREIP